jgi:arylsulfatase A-like enzyme
LDDDFVNLRTFPFNSGKRQVTAEHREIWRIFYDAAILHVDRLVGRFLKRLQQWSGWHDTIVVITADHGEMLGEHRDIVGHTLTLHDNIIHVPLLVRHLAYSTAIGVERVVQTLDLFPSILQWTGCATTAVEPAQLQRAPLSAAIHNAGDGGGLAFAEEDHTDSYNVLDGLLKVNPSMDLARYPQQQIAVRSATHKYTWYDSGPGELYNMVSDPDERDNLIASSQETDQALKHELHQHLLTWRVQLRDFPPRPAGRALTDLPAVAERLRALGYLA